MQFSSKDLCTKFLLGVAEDAFVFLLTCTCDQ